MDINLGDALILLAVFVVWAIICGFLYSEIWRFRGNRGHLDRPLNKWYSRSEIKTKIDFLGREILTLKTTVNDFVNGDLEKKLQAVIDANPPPQLPTVPTAKEIIDGVTSHLPSENSKQEIIDGIVQHLPSEEVIAEKTKKAVIGHMGGITKAMNLEEKEILAEVAEVTAVEYPNLLWVAENIDTLVEAEIIGQAWVDKFHRLTKIPFAMPFLEKASGKIRVMFEQSPAGNFGKSRRANYIG